MWKIKSELHVSMKEEGDDCFDFFNPLSEEAYMIEMFKWSDAFISFLSDCWDKDVMYLKDSE